ncbi:ATPase, AAA family [Ancylostoma ceylanicum]|uniref:ATPase, AAA family n=1 Tax=Ancylostoma ceylanicum TaxID=53326 RepID=A0A0D6LZ49_9BILA|nr:ATPase, AAA family [Ancylostoma ceylanicum]
MGNRLGAVQRKREKPEHAAMKVSMKRVKGLEHVNKLPNIIPRRHCLLRLLKQNRVHDYLLLEMEFIKRQNSFKSLESQKKEERKVVQQLRGTPTTLAKVHELFNDEQDLLHLNALVMVKASGMFKNVPTAIVGVLPDTTDSSALGHKLDKPPKETFEDIGGLESPIQEMKESVELPLTHPEYYEEMGITAPKGVILYGEPGTGKTLLAKAVANSTAATFIRATGADLVQKNSGDGAKLVRELFKMAKDNAPSIVFLDEIDAVGTKRYDTSSRGEQEIHTSGMNLAKDVSFDAVMAKEKTMSGAEIKAVCTEAGMLALRGQRKVVCADDFEKAIKNVMLKNKGGAPEEFYS